MVIDGGIFLMNYFINNQSNIKDALNESLNDHEIQQKISGIEPAAAADILYEATTEVLYHHIAMFITLLNNEYKHKNISDEQNAAFALDIISQIEQACFTGYDKIKDDNAWASSQDLQDTLVEVIALATEDAKKDIIAKIKTLN